MWTVCWNQKTLGGVEEDGARGWQWAETWVRAHSIRVAFTPRKAGSGNTGTRKSVCLDNYVAHTDDHNLEDLVQGYGRRYCAFNSQATGELLRSNRVHGPRRRWRSMRGLLPQQSNPEPKIKARGITISDFKLYFRDMVTETVCYWHRSTIMG